MDPILENVFVRFTFDGKTAGLKSLFDKKSGVEHFNSNGKPSLFKLLFRFGEQEHALFGNKVQSPTVKMESPSPRYQQVVFEWKGLDWWREIKAVSVRITVELPADSGIAAFRIWVENRSEIWSLYQVVFPDLSGFLKAGEYDVACPRRNWGKLFKKCDETLSFRYPMGWEMPMQFMAAEKKSSGVYLATHDPLAWFKRFTLDPGVSYSVSTFAENCSKPGNGFSAPFPAMVGVFQGNWLTACKIYRKFALTAPWTVDGPVSKRKSVPQSIKDTSLWMLVMNHIGNKKGTLDERNRPLVEAQGYLGVPVAAHWYNWHQIPFDNQHPNFFPAKPGIPEQVKDLVQKGFIVMPYTNARLVDSNNSDFSDVLPHTIKDRLGKFNLEIYGNHSGRMAPICPHTKFWQDKVTSFVERGADEVGVNAVYLDQISAECPVLCYDDSHGHPLGGGHWWVDAYQKLLVQVQAAAHKDGRNMVITTECAAEPYMKGVDAYLIWVNRDIRDIPMITAVYSGYSLYIGSPAAFEHGDRAWIAVQGQAFLWGAQNGWMGLELFAPENINKREYFRRIGQYRVALKAYLTYGELLGPIKPAGTVSTFREIWPRSYGNPLQRINISGDEENQGTLAFDKNETSDDVDAPIVELPSLDGAIWKSEAGTLCLLLVNFLEEENAFELELDLSAYGVVPGVKGYSLWIVEPEGKRKAGTLATPVVKQTERLGRWEIRALEIKPE